MIVFLVSNYRHGSLGARYSYRAVFHGSCALGGHLIPHLGLVATTASILLLSISKIYFLPFQLSSRPQLPSTAAMASNFEFPEHDATACPQDVATVEPQVLL